MYIYIHICMYINMYMLICVCIYIHIYIHILLGGKLTILSPEKAAVALFHRLSRRVLSSAQGRSLLTLRALNPEA